MDIRLYSSSTTSELKEQQNALLKQIKRGGVEKSCYDDSSIYTTLRKEAEKPFNNMSGYAKALYAEALYRDSAYLSETRGYLKTLGLHNTLRKVYNRAHILTGL